MGNKLVEEGYAHLADAIRRIAEASNISEGTWNQLSLKFNIQEDGDVLLDQIVTVEARLADDPSLKEFFIADEAIRNRLANYAHDAWSSWMKYMLARCIPAPRGQMKLPSKLAGRWARQMITPFDELPEHEKESDLREVNKILEALFIE